MLEFDLAEIEKRVTGTSPVILKRTDRSAMVADPPGVYIRCELHSNSRAEIIIRTRPGNEHVAHVIVVASGHASITLETINIATTLYWAWWRARGTP